MRKVYIYKSKFLFEKKNFTIHFKYLEKQLLNNKDTVSFYSSNCKDEIFNLFKIYFLIILFYL